MDSSASRESLAEPIRSRTLETQGLHLVVESPVAVRRYSRIVKARDKRSGYRYAVKTCLDPSTGLPAPHVAKRQFDALLRVFTAMGNGRFSVPEPIALDEPAAAVVTAWIDGDSMTQALARHPLSVKNAERLSGVAGEWLAAFHRAHTLANGPLDIGGRVSQVDLMLQEGPVRDRDFVAAAEFLRMSATIAASTLLPRSWIHGDFKFDNLLLASDRVVGIDVDLSFENVVVHDLASFQNHLSLLLQGPRFLRLRAARSRLVEAFCRGYRFDSSCEAALALRWATIFQLLDIWKEAETRSRPFFKRLGFRLALQHCSRVLVRDARSALAALR